MMEQSGSSWICASMRVLCQIHAAPGEARMQVPFDSDFLLVWGVEMQAWHWLILSIIMLVHHNIE